MKTIMVCKECGSDRVQQLMWVDLKTGETLDPYTGEIGSWCSNCRDLRKLTPKKVNLGEGSR